MREIISGCIRNDRISQQMLYKEFYSYCMGICKRYAINDFDAADVMNTAFLKVFNHIKNYNPDKPFKAWIGRIVTNTAIDHYRANLRFTTHHDISEREDIGVTAVVYEQFAYRELLDMVQTLSPGYRTVFNMYAIDGYTHEEIAEILKISVGTSKSNLYKARQKLQERISTIATLNRRKEMRTVQDINNNPDERRA